MTRHSVTWCNSRGDAAAKKPEFDPGGRDLLAQCRPNAGWTSVTVAWHSAITGPREYKPQRQRVVLVFYEVWRQKQCDYPPCAISDGADAHVRGSRMWPRAGLGQVRWTLRRDNFPRNRIISGGAVCSGALPCVSPTHTSSPPPIVDNVKNSDSYSRLVALQAQQIEPTLAYCWATVVDGGTTIRQRWFNVSYFSTLVLYALSLSSG